MTTSIKDYLWACHMIIEQHKALKCEVSQFRLHALNYLKEKTNIDLINITAKEFFEDKTINFNLDYDVFYKFKILWELEYELEV